MNRKSLLMVCQVLMAAALLLLFFTTVPWLGTQDLSALPSSYHGAVPDWARSFTNDHGNVVFHRHGTVKDEPVEFAFRAGGMVVLFALLGLSIWLPRRSSASARLGAP